ncbi:MAG: putative toxin-antitoxin system toxin component, PIN family [Halobacteriales archaeon]
MRAVLDTNVLISAVISTGTSHEVLVKGFEGSYTLVVSPETIQEFEDTLLKYPDKFQMSSEEVQKERDTIEYFAEFVNPETEVDVVVDDESDNMFLEAAVSADAEYVVSGDPHLLDLDDFRGIEILPPDEFLEKLN